MNADPSVPVVDDDAELRRLLEPGLQRLGYDVDQFESIAEALS